MVFVPITQKKGDSILFVDLRGAISGEIENNISLGLGHRKIINDKFILGTNASIARRQSANDNTYSQAQIGVEVLFSKLDLTANFYLPLSEKENTLFYSEIHTASLVGNQAFINTLTRGTYEKAHQGFDLGFNYNIGEFKNTKISVDGTYYNFGSDDFEDIKGYSIGLNSKTRIEGEKVDVEIGANVGYREDNVHGSDVYAGVNASLYLGKKGSSNDDQMLFDNGDTSQTVNDLEGKFYQQTRRNNYVVTSTRNETNNYTNQGTITVADKTYDEITSTIDNSDDLVNAVNNAGENTMVVLDGERGAFVLNEVLDVHEDQTLVGGGTPVLVTGPNGQQAILVLPGQNATVVSTPGNGLQLNQSSRLVNVSEYTISGPVNDDLDLIINGSFEDGFDLNGRRWNVFSDILGWNADLEASDAPIEIQREIVLQPSDGQHYLELDSHDFRGYSESNAHIYQDVDTEEGQAYRLVFDYSPRVRGNAETNKVEVYFEGEKVGEFTGDERGWQTKEILVIANSVDVSRLEFRGSGTEDTYGALIDNVKLEVINP